MIYLPCKYTNKIYIYTVLYRNYIMYVCIKYKHTTNMTYIHVSPILGAPLQFAVCLVPSLGSPGSLAQPSSLRVAAKPPDREEDPPTRWMRTKYRR